ncbi:MAG TPA: glycosyltransferase family A protein [Actinomycetota bacterium]|nr:glycosyltransferase family A protein [Actinomycetota bacterium]
MSVPPVTAVVPTRDRPELVRRALRAILGQRYDGDIECLVVFDRSDPKAIEVTTGPGRRVHVVSNDHRPGLAGARNAGAERAGGELLAFCDDDDEWLPDKLRLQVEALDREPGSDVASSGIVVEYRGRSIERLPPAELVTFRHLLHSRVAELHSSTLLVRRSAFLERIGQVDEEIPGSFGEDYEWLLRAARLAPIVAVPRPLVRVHWGTASYFEGRWRMMAEGLTYLLQRYPEFETDPRGLARVSGQIAFALAGAGDRALARSWARRTLRADWRERRAYLAFLVSLGLLRPETILRLAHSVGKGI